MTILGNTGKNDMGASSAIEEVLKARGRSSKKIQEEFPILRKKYWGRRLWGRGYFSSTSGNVTDNIINEYINKHSDAHEPQSNIRIE